MVYFRSFSAFEAYLLPISNQFWVLLKTIFYTFSVHFWYIFGTFFGTIFDLFRSILSHQFRFILYSFQSHFRAIFLKLQTRIWNKWNSDDLAFFSSFHFFTKAVVCINDRIPSIPQWVNFAGFILLINSRKRYFYGLRLFLNCYGDMIVCISCLF